MANSPTISDILGIKISKCIDSISVPLSITPGITGYTHLTEFKFEPKLTDNDFLKNYHKGISQIDVFWGMGDGNIIKNRINPSYIYTYPGEYGVFLYLYDSDGGTLLNAFQNKIKVSNVVSNSIIINKPNFNINSSIINEDANNIPFIVRVGLEDFESPKNVFFAVDRGKGTSIDDLPDLYDPSIKYSHLLPYRGFYTRNNTTGEYIYQRSKVQIPLTPLRYYLDDNNEPQQVSSYTSLENIRNSKIVGGIGNGEIYYYDDLTGKREIKMTIDTSNHRSPDAIRNNSQLPYQETNSSTISGNVIPKSPTKLIFTSTGIPEMKPAEYKRQNSPFQLFVGCTDDDENSIFKFYNTFYYEATGSNTNNFFTVTAENENGNSAGSSIEISGESINPIFPHGDTPAYLSTSNKSSRLKSIFHINVTPKEIGTYTLKAKGTPVLSERRITGGSTITIIRGETSYNIGEEELEGEYTFKVLPEMPNIQYKINERDFDYKELLKSYRYQPFLNNYNKFFDNVLGNITGTAESLPTTYGKTIYEKISNFVINNTDVDTCSIDNIIKLYNFLNEENSFTILPSPPELKRLINLYSIRYKRLLGDKEKFDRSFEHYMNCSTDPDRPYNKNIDFSSEISVDTYTVTAGTKFVAVQRPDNAYILINPMKVPNSTITSGGSGVTDTYPLNKYNILKGSDWGWGLDRTVQGSGLKSLYSFYPYVEYYNNIRKNNILDSEDADLINSINEIDNIIYGEIDYQIRKGIEI